MDPWSSWVRVRAGAASLPGRLASRSRVAPTHTQRLPPPLKITAASLSHRLARHRGRGEHRIMFATWPGSSTVDASHASEVKSIYASARCTCTRLVGTLPPLAPPSVRGERSILCKQVLTEDSTSSPSPSLSRAKVSGCSRSVRLARMTSARECTYGPKPHAHALISGTASLMSA